MPNLFRKVKIEKGRFYKREMKPPETQVYLHEEEEQILQLAEDDYKKKGYTSSLAICMNFFLGLRIAELMALKESDRRGNYLYVQRQEIRIEKQNKDGKWRMCGYELDDYLKGDKDVRILYLTEDARRYWDMIVERNKEMGCSDDFLIMHNGRHVHYQAVGKRLKRYCKKLNIEYRSNHKIRKSVLSTLVDEVGVDEAMRWGGHSHKSTLLNNYHFSRKTENQREIAIEKALEVKCNQM